MTHIPYKTLCLAVALTVCAACQWNDVPPLQQGEQALASGRIDEARTIIDEGLREARDSDEYYEYKVLESKLYFATMQADSFLLSNHQLSAFLGRLHKPMNHRQLQLEAEREMQLGVYEAKMVGRMDSAMVHNLKALQLIEQHHLDQDDHLVVLTNIADAYKQMGQYDQSVSYYLRAMELGDSLGMGIATRSTLDIGIASAYAAMGSFDESEPWWNRAAELEPQMQQAERFHYLNNRGNDYYLQGRYTESLGCFLRLDSLYGSNPNTEWERMFGRTNMADIYIKLGQPQRATELLDEVEPFFTRQQLDIVLYYITTQRIELAMLDHRTREALDMANASGIPEAMIPEQKLLRLKVLTRLYEQAGDWQRYALAVKQQDQLQDSIAGYNTKMRFSAAIMQYDHERQMLEKQQQLEESEITRNWIIFVAVSVILLLLFYYFQKQHMRRLKEQAMHNQIVGLRMETVRNRITPHFMGNALSHEIMAQMEGREVDLNSLVQLLHRGIEMTGTEQTTLADELEFIRFYCDIESRSVGDDFRLNIEMGESVDPQQVQLPSMLIQILVENSIKHGLKCKEPRTGHYRFVTVKAERQGEGTRVSVIDNGKGLPADRMHSEHTGLRVIQQTIALLNEQNQQKMEFELSNCQHADGDTGCQATLYLPDHYEYSLNTPPTPDPWNPTN